MDGFEVNVFINCPFDEEYKPLLDAILFAVTDCGFRPRCALETEDSAEVRIERIYGLIGECRLGIHDISRTELNPNNLPRFNMPLELGIFLGARRYGRGNQERKRCLILERDARTYQHSTSDIAGQDAQAHHDDPHEVIKQVRNWLQNIDPARRIPGPRQVIERFDAFRGEIPALCAQLRLDEDDLIYADHINIMNVWLQMNG